MSYYRFFNKLYLIVGTAWLFLVVFISGGLTGLKSVLLFLLALISIIDIHKEKIKWNINFVKYIALFIAYCLFSLIIGLINQYPFSFTNEFGIIQYYFITPICILLLSTSLSFGTIRRAHIWKLLLYFTFILAILDVLKVTLNLAGLQPAALSFIELYSEVVIEGELSLRVKNESSFFFLLPISIYYAFNSISRKERRTCIITTIFGCIYAILSGRKMLELEMIFVFIFAIAYKHNITKYIKRHLKTVIATIFSLIVLIPILLDKLSELIGIDNVFKLAVETIQNGLSSGSVGMSKRSQNSNALFELWSQSPLFGNGLNSYAPKSIANPDTKWSYEVFYNAWLAQTGIIGMSLLLIAIIYISKRLLYLGNIKNNRKYYALFIGFICFVIAGSSNPLLYFVWPWTIVMIFCLNTSFHHSEIKLKKS